MNVFGPNADNVLRELSHAGAWGPCVTANCDKKSKQVRATTVHEKMWCAVGVSVYTPRRLPGDQISGLNKEGKNTVQSMMMFATTPSFDLTSSRCFCCQCDDEDECVVLKEG